MKRKLSVHSEAWVAKIPFRITGYTMNEFPVVVCEIEQAGHVGRGEACGIYYFDETPATMTAQVESVVAAIEGGCGREDLQTLLPPGGARNAVDCALWDLEAKLGGKSVWQVAGVGNRPVETVFTIGLEDEPEQMADRASKAKDHQLLKIKLNADRPVERVTAIRSARPEARLVVDANQAFTFSQLQQVAPRLAEQRVLMLEQPLPRGEDEQLETYKAPLPLCGDESCLHRGELDQAARRYQLLNIKLDKTGGLTEALLLAREAKSRGLRLMVGCMGGTSLSMAPAHVIAQMCEFVDIDGPLLIRYDRPGGLCYSGGSAHVPTGFWGRS